MSVFVSSSNLLISINCCIMVFILKYLYHCFILFSHTDHVVKLELRSKRSMIPSVVCCSQCSAKASEDPEWERPPPCPRDHDQPESSSSTLDAAACSDGGVGTRGSLEEECGGCTDGDMECCTVDDDSGDVGEAGRIDTDEGEEDEEVGSRPNTKRRRLQTHEIAGVAHGRLARWGIGWGPVTTVKIRKDPLLLRHSMKLLVSIKNRRSGCTVQHKVCSSHLTSNILDIP